MKASALTDNWKLKVFSLLMATVLFLFVSVESVTPIDVDFPIKYITADNMMVTGEAPEVLHTTLQGPWAAFRTALDLDAPPPITIDLTAAGVGPVRHRIETEDIEAPAGMRIVAIRPAELEVTIDRVVEKQVPVNVDISSRPGFGYEIIDVRAEPARVLVTGPAAMMRTLDFVFTRPVGIEEREDDLALEVELRPPQAPMKLRTKRVLVTVDIGEEFVQKRFEDVPILLENAPENTKISPSRVSLTLKGPRKLVDRLQKEEVVAFVDVGEEAAAGARSAFEKPVELRDLPERTVRDGVAPTVVVELPNKRKRRRRR